MTTRKRTHKAIQEKTRHTVEGSLENFLLIHRNYALTLEVSFGKEKIGKLEVGSGSLTWHPYNRKTRYKLGWKKFGQLIEERGRKVPTQ